MTLKLPVLAINFKTYMQATGLNAVKLAKICAKEAAKSRKAVVVGVQAADVFRVSQAVRPGICAARGLHRIREEYGPYVA